MVDSLTRMWVLIGSHLNTRAQAQLVGLLPKELSARVSAQLRERGGDDMTAEGGELSPAEQRVRDGFRRRRDPEEGDDGESTDDDTVGLVCMIVVVTLLSYLSTWVFSPRAAFVHVGSALGTAMAANVYFQIIPNHIKMRKQV